MPPTGPQIPDQLSPTSGASMAPHPLFLFTPWGELASSILAGLLLIAGLVAGWLGAETVSITLYWIALGVGMIHGLRAAWDSLSQWRFDIDVLMAVGAAFAGWLGHPGEGGLLLFLFVLAGALEDLASARTTRAVEALHKLMPTSALRRAPDNSWETIEPEQLRPGDEIKILPGESVPADARLSEGSTSVDQSNLTGESMPRSVRAGDEIFAGTINVGDPVIARVTRMAKESSLQRVLNLVLEAQQQREPVQRIIDRVNQPYALSVLGVSIAVLLIWRFGFGDTWQVALYTAITLLIVASPCAVIIATPTATLAAIARGARAGVLFKGGQSIERLARLGGVAFDKTGTLTVGKMRVQELHPIGWSDAGRLLSIASALEQDSTHPIAVAVRDAAQKQGVEPAASQNPRFVVGRGVAADFSGKPARLGTYVFVEELIPICLRAQVRGVLDSVQHSGRIGTVVAHDEQAGVIILSDTVRPGAAELVTDLHALGVRPVVMLTGDNRATARAVAEALGLDDFKAELLPQDKVDAIQQIKATVRARDPKSGAGVIGDGVNDAPALAAADVSIAIGSIGSDAALESADIVLLADDLGVVPWAVGLARRARRTILFNLSFALTAILIMAIATLVGSRTGHPLPLWLGVLGHEGGTMLVVLASLLLLIYPARRRGVESPVRETELPEPRVVPESRSKPPVELAQ